MTRRTKALRCEKIGCRRVARRSVTLFLDRATWGPDADALEYLVCLEHEPEAKQIFKKVLAEHFGQFCYDPEAPNLN